jgi:ankyrin repeat protein
VRAQNKNGIQLLSLAAQTDCLQCAKALLDAGADVKMKDKDAIGRTALHWAAEWSTLGMVHLLVARGASLNARTAKGDTPLSFAKDNFYKDNTTERKKIVSFLSKPAMK